MEGIMVHSLLLAFKKLMSYLSYNWKFLPFDCLHPIKTSPPPVITNLISFSMNMFVFEVLSTYDTVLVPVTQHSDLIFLYISKWSPQ